MKYLVTGGNGQLGYDIVRELKARGITDIVMCDRSSFDITDRESTVSFIVRENPDVIFHCAAWTQVDKAEDMEDLVYQVNVEGTKNITDAAKICDSKLFYISTDYVFDGTKDGLYEVNDIPNPMSVYGKTKYLGEEITKSYPKSFIVRISWVFGINGNNFIKTMLKLSETRNELNIVDDQIGSPTYTYDLSKLLVDMSYTDKYGIYHATNSGFCSWAELAECVFALVDREVKVNKVTTLEYLNLTGSRQAYRPRNSKLSKSSLVENGFDELPSFEDAAKRYIKELSR